MAQSGNPPSGSGIDGSASSSPEESVPPSTGFGATPEERKELIRHTIDVWEGGYVDDPDDPGGETNFGITTSAIDDYMRLTRDDRFKNKSPGQITRTEAELIYDTIMTGYQIDQIEDPNIRAQVFDMVVNMGPGGGMTILHNVLLAREEDVGKGIEIGPKTRGVLNGLFRAGQEAELAQINNALARAREARYEQLIQEKPSLAKFRRGWLRRARSFLLPEEAP